MAKKSKIKAEQIFSVIAHGHSFTKHVLGQRDDNRTKLIGANEFRHSGHGPDLKIEKPEDFEKYLSNNLDKGKWEGFSHPGSQKYYFYNKNDNVILILSTHQSSDKNGKKVINDLGTIYRPPLDENKGGKLWKELQRSEILDNNGVDIKRFNSSENGIQSLTHTIDGKNAKTQNLLDIALNAIGRSGPRRVLDYRAKLIEEGKDAATLGSIAKEAADAVKGSIKPGNTNAAELIIEAVDKADEGAKATKAARAAKLGKLGLVTSVGMTVIVAGFIDQAHDAKRESAELFFKGGAINKNTLDKYVVLNKSVEKMMHAENVAGQGWAFIATTPIVEAKAASMFTKFSQTYNLTPKVHKALGMSMFDGKSTIGQFSDAVFEAIPNKKEGAPKSLHALIDSKRVLIKANNHLNELRLEITPSDLGGSNLKAIMRAKESLPEAAKDKVTATVAFAKQFQKTFSDPEAAKDLGNKVLNKMSPKVLLDLTVALARSTQKQANVNPLIRSLAESQEKQSSFEVKKTNIDKQLISYKDGESTMSKFTAAAFEVLPSKKEFVPKSLHALIDSKIAVQKAGQNLTKMANDLLPSGPMVGSYLKDIKNAKEDIADAQWDKANAKLDYSKQFHKAVSDPIAIKYLASRLPKNLIPKTSENTFMKNVADIQVRQSGLEVKKIGIEKQLEDSKELTRTLEKKLSSQPDIVKNYIIKQMGNKKPAKTLETDPQKTLNNNEEKSGTNSKKGKLESTGTVIRYRSLSSAEKKQYLPAQAWKQLGFLPQDGEKGDKFAMRNARGEEKQLQLYSANSVRAEDLSDKRDPAQVSLQYQKQVAQIQPQKQKQSQEMDV